MKIRILLAAGLAATVVACATEDTENRETNTLDNPTPANLTAPAQQGQLWACKFSVDPVTKLPNGDVTTGAISASIVSGDGSLEANVSGGNTTTIGYNAPGVPQCTKIWHGGASATVAVTEDPGDGSAFYFYRLARRSESDFFLAGRGLPWWLPASSVFSTHTATDTPMWVAGVVYAHGLRGLWYTFFAAWTSVGAFVSTRMFRRSLAYTQAEWQVVRFGGLGAELLRGWIAGWQVFMNMFILAHVFGGRDMDRDAALHQIRYYITGMSIVPPGDDSVTLPL